MPTLGRAFRTPFRTKEHAPEKRQLREAGEPAPAEGVLEDEDEVDEQDFL